MRSLRTYSYTMVPEGAPFTEDMAILLENEINYIFVIFC